VSKLCFMVMPFGRKPTGAATGTGPAEIDFNRLWDLVYVPVLKELAYEPVRADQDTGSMIITQMLERLYFADLVLADMTIPNGNVYYEVGIRHAAKEGGCVMLAADWSRQLFDLAQMRTGRYPLPEGDITEATALAIRPKLKAAIQALSQGRSPMHDCIKGYPSDVNPAAASTMQAWLARQAEVDARLRALRARPLAQQLDAAFTLATSLLQEGALTTTSALQLVQLMRDAASDKAARLRVLAYIDGLPADVAQTPSQTTVPELAEQRALLLSQAGDVQTAIEALLAVIAEHGPSPERLGLLAGRYKRLADAATDPAEQRSQLNEAIRRYEEGMAMDLNEYYCSSNLPRLYRQRAGIKDELKAQRTLNQVLMACERARQRGASDPWLRPTLLNAAFDAADATKAEELLEDIANEGLARWKLDSIHQDLLKSAAQASDAGTQARLTAVIRQLVPGT
jgi:hypothetical protein